MKEASNETLAEATDFFMVTNAWLKTHFIEVGIALGIAVLIIVILMGVKSIALKIVRRAPFADGWSSIIASTISKTGLWFIVILAARLVQRFARPPAEVADVISFLFVVASVVQVAIWVRTLAIGIVEHRAMSSGADGGTITSAVNVIKLLLSVAVFAIAAIIILDNLGVNVTGLVAGLGIGGIAIGLAAQGIFSDLFAALSILFDKPFKVGDTITYGTTTGTVENIGLKSTRIRALTGELKVMSNTALLGQELTNFSGRTSFRFHILIGIIYQTDPDLAEQVPDIMRVVVEEKGFRFIRSAFVNFNASSIDFEVLFEVDETELAAARLKYQSVALALLRRFNERGIEFAYPTQTTFTAAPDGTMIMPYAPAVVKSDTPKPA